MNYIERPVAIIDKKTKVLQTNEVKLVKVEWNHCRGFEYTWEPEDEMRDHYPDLCGPVDFEDED